MCFEPGAERRLDVHEHARVMLSYLVQQHGADALHERDGAVSVAFRLCTTAPTKWFSVSGFPAAGAGVRETLRRGRAVARGSVKWPCSITPPG